MGCSLLSLDEVLAEKLHEHCRSRSPQRQLFEGVFIS